MTENDPFEPLVHFYDTHPINEESIFQKLRADGVSLDTLTEDTLQVYDMDHYGGVEAIDILAEKAKIDEACYVLDVCCGVGGPARYLAQNYRCRVIGLDLTASRVQSAQQFAQLVKLDHLVAFRQGNALDMPFTDDMFDVVIGQEAWVHVPDKTRLIAECARVLKPGGRIAFTDMLQRGMLTSEEEARLRQHWGGFASLETTDGYRQLLGQVGCTISECEDLSDYWAEILQDRLAMYRGLKEQTVEKFGLDHYEQWDSDYSFYVGLFTTRQLGGARFIAQLDTP
jgi:sarcosine/dimethylglycine N-methyltransferase